MTGAASDVLIIGAGLSGLLAAHRLQSKGLRVQVLDKGRGVGGRMATRRIENGTFDHGAQFFTVRAPRFQSLVDAWTRAGLVEQWASGFSGPDEAPEPQGHPRYRASPTMTAVPKAIARDLDVTLQIRATALRQTDSGWEVAAENGLSFRGRALIATPPVPQSLALLDAGETSLPQAVRKQLNAIQYDPCIALLVLASSPGRLPEPGALRFERGTIRWIADNLRKGVSGRPAYTIHTSPGYSRASWGQEPEQIAETLLTLVEEWIDPASVRTWQVQKWRYSQPQTTWPERCLSIPGPAPLIFAGDAFGGARVEGAALSGLAAADLLLSRSQKRRA